MLVVAFALALLQESPTPRALADAVDGRNVAESFRAISQLVDLADTRRVEVENESARLPAFYRKVLLSELKSKRVLGDRFGRGIRMDLKENGRDLWDYLEEIGRLPGMTVKIEEWNRKYGLTTPFDLDLKDVWAIEAMARVCDIGRHGFSPSWMDKAWSFNRGWDGGSKPPVPQSNWFFYRNIAVRQPYVRWRKLIDFSGPPKWRAILGVSVTLGPETPAVMWKDMKAIEVLGEDGKEMKRAPAEDTAIPGFESNSPSGVPGPMEIAVELADRTESKISRLRCSLVACVPQERRHYVIDEPLKKATAGDEYFEVTLLDPETHDSWSYGPEIHVRPKKTPHADLAGIPCTVLYRFEANSGAPGAGGFVFSGKGESMVARTPFGTLRPGAKLPGGEKLRQLLRVEVIIPIGLQDRPIFVEFRDIPLR